MYVCLLYEDCLLLMNMWLQSSYHSNIMRQLWELPHSPLSIMLTNCNAGQWRWPFPWLARCVVSNWKPSSPVCLSSNACNLEQVRSIYTGIGNCWSSLTADTFPTVVSGHDNWLCHRTEGLSKLLYGCRALVRQLKTWTMLYLSRLYVRQCDCAPCWSKDLVYPHVMGV